MTRNRIDLDRDVPVLLVRVGHYPQHHGVVGAIRSLGRLGVPVYAMVENRWTPAARSRYLTAGFVAPCSGLEPTRQLVDTVMGLGRAVGRRAVALPTDDEAAVLLAENAQELAEHFLLPSVPSGLPRRLADKAGLYEICTATGTPTPRAAAPPDLDAVRATALAWGYPLILKNLAPYTRLRSPVVGHSTVVRDEAELVSFCAPGAGANGDGPSVLLQEYLPPEHSQDWCAHLVCGPGGEPLTVFTGRKVRSWPPDAGVTARGSAESSPELARLAAELCRRIGYAGAADMDWRYDGRDGRYKLVDFNPRTGAQFRMFETVDGVDVVRALHLSLTGRPVPDGPQRERQFASALLDVPSALVQAWNERRVPPSVGPRRSTERAWLCRDDPLPGLVELGWYSGTVADKAVGAARRIRGAHQHATGRPSEDRTRR
ncbi:ATP-grasp domain-containing protein [Kitasatospora terrestris]|uniref:ATP-grasp domain-containing protein n=1 Tax=Kitasatospora terrestris TaxID=258051 RepID=A0ABP9E9E9_9ACTN